MLRDGEFIRILDAALAEAARKSGSWLVCRPGCAQCCIGPFPITQLDAQRLRDGLAELQSRDPERAAQVRERARAAAAQLIPGYPGDPATGVLDDDEEGEPQFATLAEELPCPALDPHTRTCDLYAARPVTCRTFGPPLRWGEAQLGICDLCFRGASDEEIAACEVELDVQALEADVLDEHQRASGTRGQTTVAFALLSTPVRSPAST